MRGISLLAENLLVLLLRFMECYQCGPMAADDLPPAKVSVISKYICIYGVIQTSLDILEIIG